MPNRKRMPSRTRMSTRRHMGYDPSKELNLYEPPEIESLLPLPEQEGTKGRKGKPLSFEAFRPKMTREEALKKARAAKREKATRRKTAASKRTKVAQALKRTGISSYVSSTGQVTLMRDAGPTQLVGPYVLRQDIVISHRERARGPRGMRSPFEKPPEDQPQTVQDFFMSSRAIRRMAYDTQRSILEIIFQTGYGYHFFGVPRGVWNNFIEFPSKGRFFMKFIYGHWEGPKGNKTYYPNYRYRRIQ